MAIQTINLAVPNGDTPRSANTKINANFADTTHAASRMVGTSSGELPAITGTGLGGLGYLGACALIAVNANLFTYSWDTGFYNGRGLVNAPLDNSGWWLISAVRSTQANRVALTGTNLLDGRQFIANGINGDPSSWGAGWTKLWGENNTKLDTNGSLAPSSPTIDLYKDRIETNQDGFKMNPEFVRNGVGDYTLKNTTGLRNEGWYIKIPNDMNGNPKVAVAIDTLENGDLNIKTYKRTFNMETFVFEPDLDNMLDIPDGRWIDLRFNDIDEV